MSVCIAREGSNQLNWSFLMYQYVLLRVRAVHYKGNIPMCQYCTDRRGSDHSDGNFPMCQYVIARKSSGHSDGNFSMYQHVLPLILWNRIIPYTHVSVCTAREGSDHSDGNFLMCEFVLPVKTLTILMGIIQFVNMYCY